MKIILTDINDNTKNIESDLILFIRKIKNETTNIITIETGNKFIYNIQISKNSQCIEYNDIKNPIKRLLKKLRILTDSCKKDPDLYDNFELEFGKIGESIMNLEDKINNELKNMR